MKSVMFDLWHSSLLTMHVDLKSIKVKKKMPELVTLNQHSNLILITDIL